MNIEASNPRLAEWLVAGGRKSVLTGLSGCIGKQSFWSRVEAQWVINGHGRRIGAGAAVDRQATIPFTLGDI